MKKRLATLLMPCLIIASSCNEEVPHEPAMVIDDAAIENFITFIDFSVEEAFHSATNDPEKIAEQVVARLSEFEERRHVNLNYQNNRAASFAREISKGQLNADLAHEIVRLSSTAVNESQYLKRLLSLKQEILAAGLSARETSALLTQITLNERFVYYLQQKHADFRPSSEDDEDEDEECSGWWSCWGKCAAGIVGGAGTGALTFGFAGAAIGTVTVPVVGTVSMAAVGAVAGGIAGGLAGAATSCD